MDVGIDIDGVFLVMGFFDLRNFGWGEWVAGSDIYYIDYEVVK